MHAYVCRCMRVCIWCEHWTCVWVSASTCVYMCVCACVCACVIVLMRECLVICLPVWFSPRLSHSLPLSTSSICPSVYPTISSSFTLPHSLYPSIPHLFLLLLSPPLFSLSESLSPLLLPPFSLSPQLTFILWNFVTHCHLLNWTDWGKCDLQDMLWPIDSDSPLETSRACSAVTNTSKMTATRCDPLKNTIISWCWTSQFSFIIS